jgi:peptidyl-prolyl cis-trans isomerase B (cyclophilin B)
VNPERASSGSQFYIVDGKKFSDQEIEQGESMINNLRMQDYFKKYVSSPEGAWIQQPEFQQLYATNQDSANKILMKLQQDYEAKNPPFKYSEADRKAYREQGGAIHLDAQYTVFGRVVEGMDVVDTIAAQPKGEADRPITPITIQAKVIEMKKADIKKKYGI